MSGTLIEKDQQCYHCGENCDNHPVVFEEKPFCCEGCKTVYEILNQGDLCNYYRLEDQAGKKVETVVSHRYAFLDNEEVQQKLFDFTDGQLAKITLFLPNVHCSSCIWLLEKLHRLHSGIGQSSVNFIKKQVAVTFDLEAITLRQLAELLATIGYPPDISLADGQKQADKKGMPKSFFYKLGLAGFTFGNIMLLSFPEYIDTADSLNKEFSDFFGWMNLALGIPVFLYGGSDFLISAYKGLKHKNFNIDVPISIGMLALFGQSVYEIVSQTGTGYMDSLAGLIFFLLIGRWYQGKTYEALSFERDYQSYFPIAVTRLRNGAEESTPIGKLEVGDRIRIRNQELIPADAILVHGKGNIDYSFVTGEAAPVSKKSGDFLYAGGRQQGGILEITIQKAVETSYLTQLWDQKQYEKEKASSLGRIASNVSMYFTAVILMIATATAVYWYFNNPDLIFKTFIAVLIVACPCALALSMPFTFGNALRILGKQGFFLKNVQAIEDLAKIDTIAFDKTGTITDARRMKVSYQGKPLSQKELALLKVVVGNSAHPLSQAIFKDIKAAKANSRCELFEEMPSKGILATAGGLTFQVGSQSFVAGEQADAQSNTTKVYIGIDGELRGYYQIESLYREGFESVLKNLSENYDLHLLSGDNDQARQTLAGHFPDASQLHFNQTPLDKLSYIKKLKQQGKYPLMVGDGLNDAGALKQSSVGVSIAEDVYSFSPACDGILNARQFGQLDQFIRYAKNSVNIVKASFLLSFTYNIVGLYFAVSGMLTPVICAILMPVSSVSIVIFVTVLTNLMAPKLKNLLDRQ